MMIHHIVTILLILDLCSLQLLLNAAPIDLDEDSAKNLRAERAREHPMAAEKARLLLLSPADISRQNPTPQEAHLDERRAPVRAAKIIALSKLPLELQQPAYSNEVKNKKEEDKKDKQTAPILAYCNQNLTKELYSRLAKRSMLAETKKPVSYFTGPHVPVNMIDNTFKSPDGKYAITIEKISPDPHWIGSFLYCLCCCCLCDASKTSEDHEKITRILYSTITLVVWDLENPKKLFRITTPILDSDFYSLQISPDNKKLFIRGTMHEYAINLYPNYFENPNTKLNNQLSKLTLRQFELMQGFEQAIKDLARIHPDKDQWETFQSLPADFQEKLKLYIKTPASVSNIK